MAEQKEYDFSLKKLLSYSKVLWSSGIVCLFVSIDQFFYSIKIIMIQPSKVLKLIVPFNFFFIFLLLWGLLGEIFIKLKWENC